MDMLDEMISLCCFHLDRLLLFPQSAIVWVVAA